MGIWDWFIERQEEYERQGDRERLRLAELHDEGFDCHETDPQRTLALFTEGRRLAEKLGEPWWAMLYDVWRVMAMNHYLADYRNSLDLAIHCVLQMRKPQFAHHPWRIASYNSLLECYLGVDPVGYADAIRELLDFLETEIPQEPCPDRYVYLGRRRVFSRETGDWQGAYQTALAVIALGESDPDPSQVGPYTVSDVADLCWICYNLGDWDGVRDFAQQAEELARSLAHAKEELVEVLFWQAVLARRDGDEPRAQRLYRQATSRFSRLAQQMSKETFEARILYHVLGGQLARAVQTCDQTIAIIEPTGRWAHLHRIHWHRCRLLARLGKLQPADLEAARTAARRLKKHEPLLAELAELERGC